MSRLGELLVRENLISLQQLHRAQDEQRKTGARLGYSLTKLGYIREQELTSFLASKYSVPAIDLGQLEIDPEVIRLVPRELSKRHLCVPVRRTGTSLLMAMSDPANIYAIDEIKFLTGYNVEVGVASEVAIDEAIGKYYERSISPEEIIGQLDESELSVLASEEDVNVVDLERASGEAPVIRLVNYIILGAIKKGASDIHVEPYERAVRVRYRIDGVLYEELSPPPRLKAAIASRLKIMANLDIAERRLPADGRIRLRLSGGREMDFRVSTVPTLFGEKVVLRLLDRGNLQLDMTRLGFEVEQLKQFQKAIHQPFGMVLVTGPTGSGKTTTLYSALAELNQTSDNICTAEDPVEFNLPGINQVQMHEEIGLNFATALRAFLRQDPDIVMVGEIRDFETAEIAIKAALTGHIVLSTVHTNDAPSTITRLLNMGIEPFLVTAAVNLICAQRLVRRVCSECRQPAEVRHEQLVSLGMSEELIGSLHLFRGSGCRHCHNTGYRGRVALYEVMPFCDSLQEMVLQGASTAEIRAEAVRLGMQTLRMSGVTKVAQGVTTVEEVMRVTGFE